ncbi:MAG: DUF4279 domain-containing protein [Chitinophagaceae bacterium]|nr:DUF4279 domain-containing protein [Chitinophagaceae bacterium]
MEDDKVQIKAYFKIHGFECSVEEISIAMGLQPTQSWLKGDKIDRRTPIRERKFSSWIREIYEGDINTVGDEYLKYLYEFITQNLSAIESLSTLYETELTLVLRAYNTSNIGIYLSKEVLKLISQTGVNLDIDAYYFNTKAFA